MTRPGSSVVVSVPSSPLQSVCFHRVGLSAILGLSVLLLAILARVIQLQVAPGERLAAQKPTRTARVIEWAPRGDLLDRRGRPIATSAQGWRVFVDPARFPQPSDEAISRLARAVELDVDAVGTRIVERIARNVIRATTNQSLIRYVSIGSALTDTQVEAVRRLDIAGVHLERIPIRRTIDTPAAASIVGLVGADHHGLLGAERAFDSALESTPGSLTYTRDASGRTLWVQVGRYQPAVRGADVHLSVDLAIEEIAAQELDRGVADADAAGGRVIVLDPVRGEILAMTDLVRDRDDVVPFDASLIDPDTKRGPRFAVLRPDPDRAVNPALGRNRCVEDAYEPGSTFKPFMWSAVTELGRLHPDDMIDTHDGRWRTPYGRRLEDVTKRKEQTWSDVLTNSSNIGMAQGLATISAKEMRDAVVKLGFGRPSGLGIAGESAGIVTPLNKWSAYTQTSVAMGYEIGVTPVQMAHAYSAFARTGNLAGTTPTLRLTAAGYAEPTAEIVHRVFPANVARLARHAMVGVAKHMDDRMMRLGRYDHAPRYPMFGKSGTANIPRPDGKGYIEGQYISSFIAGAPTNQPRIVVLVVIDDPGPEQARKRQHYGSYVAGPVVRRIVERVLPYLGVSPAISLAE